MGAFSGHSGNVTFGSGYTVNVYSWSIDYTAEALESTDFASSGARTFIPGLTGWSGSYECRLDSATPIVAPGAAAASATYRRGRERRSRSTPRRGSRQWKTTGPPRRRG